MLCWLITFCTIARLWIVISWFVWMLWTREEVSLTDSAGIRERERERGTEGGSESERLGWHSRFANENEGRGRKWVWTTRSHSRFWTTRSHSIRTRTRGGGRKWVWTTHWIIHRKHDWTNERTNERTTLFGELNDANWFAETNHEIHHYYLLFSSVARLGYLLRTFSSVARLGYLLRTFRQCCQIGLLFEDVQTVLLDFSYLLRTFRPYCQIWATNSASTTSLPDWATISGRSTVLPLFQLLLLFSFCY